MKHDGWRKPTPELLQAERYAEVGEGLSIPKSRAIAATKRVATIIGLKAQDMLLLDTFGAFSQGQDWEKGRRPIIWASNNYLMDQTGFSLPTLKRHIRRLAEVGVISFKDSTNGKRYGRRGDDGHIQVAFGFDLAPLAARTEEFEALHSRIAEERRFCASLREKITISRRIIRSQIEKALQNGLRGPWNALQQEFDKLLAILPGRNVAANKLMNIADIFADLRLRVDETFSNAFDWPAQPDSQQKENSTSSHQVKIENNVIFRKMNPSEFINDPHILTTNQLNPVKSNSLRNNNTTNITQKIDEFEKKGNSNDIDLDINWNIRAGNSKSEVDIPMLMVACPHFAELARDMGEGYLKNWTELHRVAGIIRGIAGISEDAWKIANKILGPERAAAAIALIFDKQTSGEVRSAGGYLRAMVERAQSGELHLDRSFYGRLNGVGV